MTGRRSTLLFERAARHLVGGVGSGTRAPRSGWLPEPVFVKLPVLTSIAVSASP